MTGCCRHCFATFQLLYTALMKRPHAAGQAPLANRPQQGPVHDAHGSYRFGPARKRSRGAKGPGSSVPSSAPTGIAVAPQPQRCPTALAKRRGDDVRTP
jgi:hypothetical protein